LFSVREQLYEKPEGRMKDFFKQEKLAYQKAKKVFCTLSEKSNV